MIITDLFGGLGNQLFQYAAGRALAEYHKVELKLNILSYQSEKKRDYALCHFNISAGIATKEEIRYYKGPLSRVWDLVTLKPYYRRRHFRERRFNHDGNFTKAAKDTLITGYWQTEKYFRNISGILRNEFVLKSPLEGQNKAIADHIRGVNSVSIHARRGDYVQDADVKRVHGSCDLAYYHDSIKCIANDVQDPVFFVFSDDPEWVKNNLVIDFPTVYVSHNGSEKGHEDLRLMALCKHNIIANSTFSWWAAWLNNNETKRVSAPRKWFNDSPRNTSDIIPEGWTKL